MDIWIDCDYLDTDSSPLQDKYANKVIWLFARIINQIFNTKENRRDAPLSNSEQSTRGFEDIWEELNSWYKNRPACVQSVIEVEPAKNEAFPIILFGNQSASKMNRRISELSIDRTDLILVCGNIFYHTACLQLLEAGIQKDNQAYCHEKVITRSFRSVHQCSEDDGLIQDCSTNHSGMLAALVESQPQQITSKLHLKNSIFFTTYNRKRDPFYLRFKSLTLAII
jgi:hypothetical protein